MEDSEQRDVIPLELLIIGCARMFLSGAKIEEISKNILTELKETIELELETREATYH